MRDRAVTATRLASRELRYRRLGLPWYGLWHADMAFVGTCGLFVGDRCGDGPEIGYEVDLAHRR